MNGQGSFLSPSAKMTKVESGTFLPFRSFQSVSSAGATNSIPKLDRSGRFSVEESYANFITI